LAIRGRITVSGTREPWVRREEMDGLCWASFRKRSPAVMMRRFCRVRGGKEGGVRGRKGVRGEVENVWREEENLSFKTGLPKRMLKTYQAWGDDAGKRAFSYAWCTKEYETGQGRRHGVLGRGGREWEREGGRVQQVDKGTRHSHKPPPLLSVCLSSYIRRVVVKCECYEELLVG